MNAAKADSYKKLIEAELPHVINRTALAVGCKYTGKVRDVYTVPKSLLLVTSALELRFTLYYAIIQPNALTRLTADRLSAFDRLLACIPFKGCVGQYLKVLLVHLNITATAFCPCCSAVLNLTAAWWFEKTAHIIENHVVAVPHPNIVRSNNAHAPLACHYRRSMSADCC